MSNAKDETGVQHRQMDPSHKAAINDSKRGKEGITNEAIFLCWKFPLVKPNFGIFFYEIL